jgi:site-specific recombinase XerD
LSAENIGHRLVSQITRKHIQQIIGKRAETSGAANNALLSMRVLIYFAVDNGWQNDDPTVRIKKFALGEHYTWTERQIAQYENYWPVGTKERTAFALLLFTGQRTSDVAPMSWPGIDGNAVQVVQAKTGAKLWIPMHPDANKNSQT